MLGRSLSKSDANNGAVIGRPIGSNDEIHELFADAFRTSASLSRCNADDNFRSKRWGVPKSVGCKHDYRVLAFQFQSCHLCFANASLLTHVHIPHCPCHRDSLSFLRNMHTSVTTLPLTGSAVLNRDMYVFFTEATYVFCMVVDDVAVDDLAAD